MLFHHINSHINTFWISTNTRIKSARDCHNFNDECPATEFWIKSESTIPRSRERCDTENYPNHVTAAALLGQVRRFLHIHITDSTLNNTFSKKYINHYINYIATNMTVTRFKFRNQSLNDEYFPQYDFWFILKWKLKLWLCKVSWKVRCQKYTRRNVNIGEQSRVELFALFSRSSR